MPQKKAQLFYLALQVFKKPKDDETKHSILCTHLNQKCARLKFLVFSRTKNAQIEFLKVLGTDFE